VKAAILNRVKREFGGAMIWVLLLISVGSLTLPPLLSLATSSLGASQMYEKKTNQAYAADAGVGDGLWEIKYGDLGTVFPTYDPYDYDLIWTYNLTDQKHGNSINGYDTEVSIGNIWIPKDIATPGTAQARSIIEDGKLIVTGCTSGDSTYQIKITYNPEEGDLIVESLGVWLPAGFTYDDEVHNNSMKDECDGDDPPVYCDDLSLAIGPHKGGTSIVWDFSGTCVAVTDLPNVDPLEFPIEAEITFEYDSEQEAINPAAVAWIETSGVDGIELSWDADTKIYEITAIAGDARVEAHAAKSEARELGGPIGGDYFIIGNSLLDYTDDERYRNRLHQETSATVAEDDIPSSATIDRAYLYWTGWMDWQPYADSYEPPYLFFDDGDNMSAWTCSGNFWRPDNSTGSIEGHHVGGGTAKYLHMTKPVDLHEYTDGEITVSWDQSVGPGDQLESTDKLYFIYDGDGDFDNDNGYVQELAFSNDISPSSREVTIPKDHRTADFKIGFYYDGFDTSGEYCYIDNIKIIHTASGEEETGGAGESAMKYPDDPTYENLRILVEETARVNTVIFSGTQVTADEWRIAESTDLPGETIYEDRWSYACRYDATDLINKWIEDDEDFVDIASNGAGEYTLGHVMTQNEGNPEYSIDLWPAGTTGYPLASPAEWPDPPQRHDFCYGGWSLILIYSSAETEGHQLYLFDDTLAEIWHYNPDVDGDGEAGITVDGFLVPDGITTDDEVARVTVFAGEGDRGITGDKFFFNKGIALSSDTSSFNNIWDSQLPGGLVPGIDIDTFTINHPTLEAGATEAHIDYLGINENPDQYYSASDEFTPVYVILSFRSEVTTGGTLDYLLEF